MIRMASSMCDVYLSIPICKITMSTVVHRVISNPTENNLILVRVIAMRLLRSANSAIRRHQDQGIGSQDEDTKTVSRLSGGKALSQDLKSLGYRYCYYCYVFTSLW